jgi:hypothetical protein
MNKVITWVIMTTVCCLLSPAFPALVAPKPQPPAALPVCRLLQGGLSNTTITAYVYSRGIFEKEKPPPKNEDPNTDKHGRGPSTNNDKPER